MTVPAQDVGRGDVVDDRLPSRRVAEAGEQTAGEVLVPREGAGTGGRAERDHGRVGAEERRRAPDDPPAASVTWIATW